MYIYEGDKMEDKKEKPKLPKEEPIKTRELHDSKIIFHDSKKNKKD